MHHESRIYVFIAIDNGRPSTYSANLHCESRFIVYRKVRLHERHQRSAARSAKMIYMDRINLMLARAQKDCMLSATIDGWSAGDQETTHLIAIYALISLHRFQGPGRGVRTRDKTKSDYYNWKYKPQILREDLRCWIDGKMEMNMQRKICFFKVFTTAGKFHILFFYESHSFLYTIQIKGGFMLWNTPSNIRRRFCNTDNWRQQLSKRHFIERAIQDK